MRSTDSLRGLDFVYCFYASMRYKQTSRENAWLALFDEIGSFCPSPSAVPLLISSLLDRDSKVGRNSLISSNENPQE